MRTLLMSLMIFSMPALCGLAAAQDQEKPQNRERDRRPDQRPGIFNRENMQERGDMMLRRLPLMMVLDADQDGILSPAEIENAPKTLAKLDKNGDGRIDGAELRPEFGFPGPGGPGGPGGRPEGFRPGAMDGEMMAQMFKSRDADGDGKLSGEEIPERLQPLVARVDENGDGAIDQAELKKAMARMGERGRGGEGRDGAGVRPKRPASETEEN